MARSPQAALVQAESGSTSEAFKLPDDLPKKSKTKWVIAAVVLLGGVGFAFMQLQASKDYASKPESKQVASPTTTVAENAAQQTTALRGTNETRRGNSELKSTGRLNAGAPNSASTPHNKETILNPGQSAKSRSKQAQAAVATAIPATSQTNAPDKKANSSKRKKLNQTAPPAKRTSQQPQEKSSKTVKIDTAVARLKIVLQPKKAVYDLGDRPKVRAIAYAADGKVLKNVPTIKWSVVGPARKKGNRIHFTKDGKGYIRACSQKVCAKTRFLGLDSSGLP